MNSLSFFGCQYSTEPSLYQPSTKIHNYDARHPCLVRYFSCTLSQYLEAKRWWILRFDVRNSDLTQDHDEEGIKESIASLEALLTKEIERGISPPSRIVLGGLSQGGAMSLLTGLSTSRKLAGLIVLSGRLPIQEKVLDVIKHVYRNAPLLTTCKC